MGFLGATGCEVACDQCGLDNKRAGCQRACVQLAWFVCTKAGSLRACGQIIGEDELNHDTDGVASVVNAAYVLSGVMCVSSLQNSFVETRGALQFVFMYVSWFVMSEMSLHVSCFVMRMMGWEFVVTCSGIGDIGITCAVLSVVGICW